MPKRIDPVERAFTAWSALDELQRAKFDGMTIGMARKNGTVAAPKPKQQAKTRQESRPREEAIAP